MTGSFIAGTRGFPGLAHADFHGTGTYSVYNHTGFALLLPYIEENDLAREYRLNDRASNARWSGPGYDDSALVGSGTANIDVVCAYVKTYHCPADEFPKVDRITSPSHNRCEGRGSNYVFSIYSADWEYLAITPKDDMMFLVLGGMIDLKPGMFGDNQRTRLEDVTDGTSHTIAIGETKQEHFNATCLTQWGTGRQGSVHGAMRNVLGLLPMNRRINFPMGSVPVGNQPPLDPGDPRYYLQDDFVFGSWHPGGANFLFGDGSVHFLQENLSLPTFYKMGTIREDQTLFGA